MMGVPFVSCRPTQLLKSPFRVLLSPPRSVLALEYWIPSWDRVSGFTNLGEGMECTQSVSRAVMSSFVPRSSRPLERHIVLNMSPFKRSRDDFPILYSVNDLFALSSFSWNQRLDSSKLDAYVLDSSSPSSEVCGVDPAWAGGSVESELVRSRCTHKVSR